MNNPDELIAEIRDEVTSKHDETLSKAKWVNKKVLWLIEENQRLQQDKQKLIEGLRHYANERLYQMSWYGPAEKYTEKARSILQEIGVGLGKDDNEDE